MIDIEALHPTYRGFYEALGCDDEALVGVFKGMSGQQVNLPVHLYEPEAVKQRLSEQIRQHQEIDIHVDGLGPLLGISVMKSSNGAL